MKCNSSLLLIVLIFCSGVLVYAQSLDKLEGTYFVTQEGIVHSYDFKGRKLTVRLNINSGQNLQFVYHYVMKRNDDQTLNIFLSKIEAQEVDLNNQFVGKPKFITSRSSYAENYWSVWTLKKVEGNNIFVTVEPRSIKWPFSEGHLANYYSGFEDQFVLRQK